MNTMYGKFGRGFDVANNKKALYFNLEDAFLSNVALNGKYSVTIEVTYLDKGTGGWQFYYDAQNSVDRASISVNCNNTNLWKKATVTLNDAYFGNRGPNTSDFSIRSTSNSQNVIFSVVELSRPSSFTSKKAAAVSNNLKITQNNDFKTPSILLINPNPATSQFYIQMKNSELIKQVVICNQAGQILLQKQVSGLRIAVNRNELGGVSGIYFIKVNTASGSYSGMVTLP